MNNEFTFFISGQTGAKAAAEAMVGLAKKSSGQLMNLLKSAKEVR